MKTAFRKSFERDLRNLKDTALLRKVKEKIEEIECAEDLQEVTNFKKITGAKSFFRIRIGNFRLGVAVEGDTVEFVRCLSRRDIYRHFP